MTVKLAGIRFTVMGEVANPGTLVLFQNQVNIIEAIAKAGDITITGNRKKVTIIRKKIDKTNNYPRPNRCFGIRFRNLLYTVQ